LTVLLARLTQSLASFLLDGNARGEHNGSTTPRVARTYSWAN
jgi:hypothetical protein